jgi:hypothetical protein
MRLADLQKALRAADPAAVLVSPRILERVIREVCVLPAMYWSLPHAKSYVVDRQMLFRHAEQADLELEPDQLLPDTVLLLARPDAEELSGPETKVLLLKYWRLLFHTSIHFALGAHRPAGPEGTPPVLRRVPGGPTRIVPEGTEPVLGRVPGGSTMTGPLTPEAVRERIAQIGRTEFEEIRTVLVQDDYLPPNADERTTYIEFAAVYLELRYFAHNLLPNFFPGIRDFARIEQLLARDVDGAALFARTRLAGAPDPEVRVDSRSDESLEAYWELIRTAQRAALGGNTVRAAILRTRAARIAPAAQTISTRTEAEADVRKLTTRLAAALTLSEAEAEQWTRYLTLLLDKADQGTRPVEARVLYDLQQVCIDNEHDVYTLDLVEWVRSVGKRPIKRPLPSQRLVRIVKHLRTASQRLGAVRLSDTDRSRFGELLQRAQHKSEEALRARFGPILVTAMQDVGLTPTNPSEQAAFDKMVEEMLDRITEYGFLTFSDLRDTISRNRLKLPDLREPEDFVRGDPLLRLDRRLASLLDGVYRPSEIYMRLLERTTALTFGTPLGRLVTRFALIPFGSAFLILVLLGLIFEHLGNAKTHAWLAGALALFQGPLYDAHKAGPSPLGASGLVLHFALLVGLGFFLLGLFEVLAFRRRCRVALVEAGHAMRTIFVDMPLRVIPLKLLRRLVDSWGFQLVYWYLVKPAALVVVLMWLRPQFFASWTALGVAFLLANVLLNTRFSRAAFDLLGDGVAWLVQQIRAGLLPGLFRLIVQVFKTATDMLETLLFRVDEWLRFRAGDSQLSLVLRTMLGLVWFPISYVVRFYLLVLIEPCLNPLKLPISILAAKFVYPLMVGLQWIELGGLWPWSWSSPLVPELARYIPYGLAWVLVICTFYFLPDAFGFLAWELKENWKLYRANRGEVVRPVPVGSHGETVRALLQPGFHSGTVPRLYARLRRAERDAYRTNDWHDARASRQQLEEVAKTMKRFADRELLALLRQSRAWGGQALEVGEVHLTINRIRLELAHAAHPARALEVELKLREGWLVAGLGERGWLDRLETEHLRAFTAALANLYKLAGIDLVMEQLHANLPPSIASYDLTSAGLVLHPVAGGPSLTLDLHEGDGTTEEGAPDGRTLGVDPQRLIFARTPLLWRHWVECWQKDHDGQGNPGLPGLGLELVQRSAAIHVPPLPAPPPPPVAAAPAEITTAPAAVGLPGDTSFSRDLNGD